MSRFFANGTEGRAWEALWCNRCANDHEMHGPDGSGPGCMFMGYAISGMDDALDGVWIDEHAKYGFTFPPAIRCTEFKGCVECGDGDVVLNAEGFPSAVRQQEFMRPMGSTGPGVLITDRILTPPDVIAHRRDAE